MTATAVRAPRRIAAVLFDLDGTLVDSAPDLAGTVNDMRIARNLPPLPYAQLRAYAGSGARGMLGMGMGIATGDAGYDALRDEFHDRYAVRMLDETQLFADTTRLLQSLSWHGMPWGIVTNKARRFAEPLCLALGLRPQALVGGDSTPHTKPHPAPLLEAARRLAVPPTACVYVGDDLRDMQAGRAAGMCTLAAAWGYLGADAVLTSWDADFVLPEATALLNWLDLA